MKYIFLIIFILLLPVLGFGQQTINGSLEHDNLQRDYILYVPASYSADSPMPLLFNFHGYTSNATEQMFYGDFRPIADTANFIIVHPEGTEDNTGTTHFNVGWGASSVDDVGFSEILLEAIASEYNIDLTRVYSTGMSNGGFMSYQLACQMSDKIAAIASVTGSMSFATFANCDPQHPTPILQIHGTADQTVPYNGAIFAKPIEEVVDYWVNFNSCDAMPLRTDVPNTSTTDGSTAEHFIYPNGTNDVNTEFFKITNGGHTWAGSFFDSPGTNHDINASIEVWRFVSRYDINGLIDNTATDIEETVESELKVQIFPNPTQSFVNIELGTLKESFFEVFSSTGERLLTGTIHAHQPKIDLSDLPADVYFLQVEGRSYKILKTE